MENAMGVGKKIGCKVGVAANGNTGVAGLVERIPGSIGYVATEYTTAFDTQRAWLRNAAGTFVLPTQESIMPLPNRRQCHRHHQRHRCRGIPHQLLHLGVGVSGAELRLAVIS